MSVRRFDRLRQLAEQSLANQSPDEEQPRLEETNRLIHELRVHQIELEMQNEELHKTLDELELVKERYSDLFHFSPVGYFTLGKEGRIQDVNLVAINFLELNRWDLVGEPLTKFIVREYQDVYYQLERMVSASRKQQRVELKMIKGNGEYVDIQMDGLSVWAGEEVVSEKRIVISDISNRKQMELQRRMFFSIASHELRTPITNINLSLDMLSQTLNESITDKSRGMFDIARNNLDRLKRLVNDILTIEALESGNMVFRVQPIAPTPLIQEVVKSMDAYARSFNVKLLFKKESLDVRIQADADRLVQVLDNLLNNAVRFSPEGETVEVQLTRSSSTVRVAVTDQGPGIPADFLPHLFEPFTQADPYMEDPRHKGSAGLGLSIAKNIVERLGGQIGVESGKFRATTFYFELPEWKG